MLVVTLDLSITVFLKADLHGTTLSHTTSLRQAYDMNCFLQIKPTTCLNIVV